MISAWIVNQLIFSQVIEEKERELYEYSFKSLLGNILNIVAGIIIGILCGEILRAVIFLVVIVPLRSSIGGCHIKSPLLCFIVSCGLVTTGVLIPNIVKSGYVTICIFMLFFSLVIISIIAPVDCIEKPLTTDEKKVLGTRAKFINLFIGVFVIIVCFLKYIDLCIEIAFVVSYALITLLVESYRKGKLKIKKICDCFDRSCSKNDHS